MGLGEEGGVTKKEACWAAIWAVLSLCKGASVLPLVELSYQVGEVAGLWDQPLTVPRRADFSSAYPPGTHLRSPQTLQRFFSSRKS